ncbi:hypothetical protein [Ideonella paludis]|uniref:hypothetical protein n=1 Tax=Ideonella paludis TaxID=1233411 RepID=UPI00362D2151
MKHVASTLSALTALALVCAVTAPSAQAATKERATDWATLNGNAAHTGYAAVSLNPANFSQAWQVRLDSTTGSFNIPATGGGRVYISNKPNSAIGILTTVNLSTGATEWTKTIAGAYTGVGTSTAFILLRMRRAWFTSVPVVTRMPLYGAST